MVADNANSIIQASREAQRNRIVAMNAMGIEIRRVVGAASNAGPEVINVHYLIYDEMLFTAFGDEACRDELPKLLASIIREILMKAK